MHPIVGSSSVLRLEDVTQTETAMTSPWTVDVNQSASNVPHSCVILPMNVTVPWNNPNNIITFEAQNLFERIKATVIAPILFLIGFPANCINMAVFYKQGLKERINMCLFSLALIDIITLTMVFTFHAERIYTQFTSGERIGVVYRFAVNNNLIGLFGFAYGMMFLSAIISTERCICILFPMRAQRCIPTKALAVVIIVGVVGLMLARFAVTAMYRVTCFFEIRTQRVSWQIYVNDYYIPNKAMVTGLNGVFFGFLVTVGCPSVVLVTTTISAVKLHQIVRWRSQSSSSMSSKEIGVTKMLIALSIEFFILSIPVIILRIVPVFEPRLSPGDELANFFNLLVGVSEIFANISSSVNFFVYYSTGRKFRETLHCMIRRKTAPKRKQDSKSDSTTIARHTLTSVTQEAGLDIQDK